MICIKSDSSPFRGIALSFPRPPRLRVLPRTLFEKVVHKHPIPSGCSRPTGAGKPMDVQHVPPKPPF